MSMCLFTISFVRKLPNLQTRLARVAQNGLEFNLLVEFFKAYCMSLKLVVTFDNFGSEDIPSKMYCMETLSLRYHRFPMCV